MLDFHERLWTLVSGFARNPIPYYEPDNWVPHVTLANKDVTADNLACAVSGLLYRPVTIEIRVDHLVLLYLIGDQVGMLSRFDFED
jgi:2'-5' RNA ligase